MIYDYWLMIEQRYYGVAGKTWRKVGKIKIGGNQGGKLQAVKF